jgi:DNA-binding IscR family transcriptional regulator
MKMTRKHVEALTYVASGEYKRPGSSSEINRCVDELRKDGLVHMRQGGDGSKLCLTLRGTCVLASLT